MPGSQSYVALLLLFTNAIRICSFWRKKWTCGKLDSVAKFNTYIFCRNWYSVGSHAFMKRVYKVCIGLQQNYYCVLEMYLNPYKFFKSPHLQCALEYKWVTHFETFPTWLHLLWPSCSLPTLQFIPVYISVWKPCGPYIAVLSCYTYF